MSDRALAEWTSALQSRHLADLTFSEVSRALRALSAVYVEGRSRIARGAALSGAGKRAAFALFYGPLHYLLVRHIVRSLPESVLRGVVIDLGCGTGASGAALATAAAARPKIEGIDRHAWTVEEARWTYRLFGLDARARIGDARQADLSRSDTVLAAFVLNELDDRSREILLKKFLAHRSRGGHVLVVEPLARTIVPWWGAWQKAFEGERGQADQWRITADLPDIVGKLDRAAGLDHREITARSLWM